ncbi:g5887 [Coccomyxa elongata]
MATSTLTWLALLVSFFSSAICKSVSQPFTDAPMLAPALAPANAYGLVYDATPPVERDVSDALAPISDAPLAPMTAPMFPLPTLPVNPLPASANSMISVGRRLLATCAADKTGSSTLQTGANTLNRAGDAISNAFSG